MRLSLCLILIMSALGAAENLLRNGGFEGSDQYWPEHGVLEEGAAAQGRFSMRLDGQRGLRSASFTLSPGPMTVSLWVRAATPGAVGISLSPSNREVGQQSGWAWNGKRSWSVPTTPTWQHHAIIIEIPTIDAKGGFAGSDHAWWNGTSWILMIGGDPKPLWIDGISITAGGTAPADYVAFSPIDIALTCPTLPGYATAANLLDAGSTQTIRTAVANAASTTVAATLVWEQCDYAGSATLAPPLRQTLSLPPRSTLVLDQPLTLAGIGLVLVRATALVDGVEQGRAELPLTTLGFPKSATTPDLRERFGASYRSPHLVAAAQRIGLGWARWCPILNWAAIQPTGPTQWSWPDEALNDLWSRGIAVTATLHGIPDWAKGEHQLPKDMTDWSAADSRWHDLRTVTTWDAYVTALATRYRGKPMVFEVVNEPDIHNAWDPAIYAALIQRTFRLIKQANPAAVVQVDVTWPGVSGWTRDFIDHGGAAWFDVHTFHNYVPGELADGDAVASLQRLFRSVGAPDKKVWFNEGWTYFPTSLDYPAAPLNHRAPAVADYTVRSAATLLAAGLDKFITFHIGYGQAGKSWWDWVGSGTEWWDDHGNPTVAVGAFNVLAHFLGRSHAVRTLTASGAVLHIFQDERHGSGVAVAWAAGADCSLPIAIPGLRVLDLMGNERPQAPGTVNLRGAQRPWWLIARAGQSGEALAAALAPLELNIANDGRERPPLTWEGEAKGSLVGNPALVATLPRWSLCQVWPDDTLHAANYLPMPWNGTDWAAVEHAHGGQPSARSTAAGLSLSARAAWGGNPGQKLPALVFYAPTAGTYTLTGTAHMALWDGKGTVTALRCVHLSATGATLIGSLPLPDGSDTPLAFNPVTLALGDRLALVPSFPGMNQAGTVAVKDLAIGR